MIAQKNYIPALDGFRGIAIIFVVVSHYGLGHIIPGGFGVTLFFFISGFLITRLLINEYEKDHRINLKNFYLRRVFRLYPALLFMVTLAIGFTIFMGCGFRASEVISTLFYYRNYYMIYGNEVVHNNCTRIFDITWSLAIEEHFYLFFPLLFMALYRRPMLLATVMVTTIVAVLAWRLQILAVEGLSNVTVYKIYHLTETRLDAIMFGCLVSLILHIDRQGRYSYAITQPFVFIGTIGLLIFTFIYRDGAFRETWRYSLQGLALSCIIPAVLYGKHYTGLKHWLSSPILVTIGKLSYSIYLFHWVGVCVAENIIGGERLKTNWLLVAVPMGFILSLISFYYVEKPTEILRKRFGSTVFSTASTNSSLTTKHQAIR